MSDVDNEQFGRIALRLGFCTAPQIERCLRIQSSTDERLSLGQSLVREGFISDAQYSKVLENQRAEARREAAAPSRIPQDQEDELLGKLAVRQGWITAAEVRECRRAGRAAAPPRSLVEVMVERGHLDAAGARELRARFSRRPMSCSACAVSFSVLSVARSSDVACPRCGHPLAEGALATYQRAADPHATQTFMKALSATIRPPKRDGRPRAGR